MKKKLLFTLLLVTLFFVTGCNKEEQNPVPTPTAAAPTEAATPTPSPSPTPTSIPTPTATPTPTPIPENLAMTGLQNLSSSMDSFLDNMQVPTEIADFSNGVGFDIALELSFGDKFTQEALGIEHMDPLKLQGTIDVKDTLAAKGSLYLKDTKLVTGELFTDYKTIFYNLPDYSTQYASYPLEEIIDISAEELTEELTEYTDNVALGIDNLEFLLTNFKLLLDCFQPQEGIESGCTIGSGNYTVIGDKHTVYATSDDLNPILTALMNDERTPDIVCDLCTSLLEIKYSYIQLNYYAGTDGAYAWEILFDNASEVPIIFASTPAGFRLYAVVDGEEDVLFYSEATGTNSGIVTLLSDDGTVATAEYEIQENDLSLEIESDGFLISLAYALKGEKYKYNATIVAEGMSILTEMEGTQGQFKITLTFATYGMKMYDVTMDMKFRDYCETTAPTEVVDNDTWMSRFNYNAMATDILSIAEKFPYLKEAFEDEEESENTEIPEDTPAPTAAPEPTTAPVAENDFSDMTGYAVAENGYVDFDPLESEVLAKGQPSTGYYHIKLPAVTKSNLLNLGAGYFENTYESVHSDYNISGNTTDGIYSYYCKNYGYFDLDNADLNNSINIAFDPVSEDLVWIYCYHESEAEVIKMSNNVLEILGVDYIVTEENIGYYDIYDNYYIEAVYDDEVGCYTILINPYFE